MYDPFRLTYLYLMKMMKIMYELYNIHVGYSTTTSGISNLYTSLSCEHNNNSSLSLLSLR